MPRQEPDLPAGQGTPDKNVGRRSKGSLNCLLLTLHEPLHFIESASSYHADSCFPLPLALLLHDHYLPLKRVNRPAVVIKNFLQDKRLLLLLHNVMK